MRVKRFSILVVAVLLTTVAVIAQQRAVEPSAERLQKDVSYLASDALEGRRTGTKGANDASRYIADEFSRLKLRRSLQSFPYVAGVELGKGNALTFGPNQGALRVGVDWLPLGFSTNAKIVSAPVSVGYGITASELNHDDYAGVNAKGKIAIATQGTPDGDNPHGRFVRFEGVRWKAIAARNAGASALIVVARDADFKSDRLAKLTFDNQGGDAGIPVVLVSRPGLEKIQGAAEISLSTDVVRKVVPAYNVIGVLEGSDPVLKNENIVIGAHYDHLGRGGEGSLAPDSGEIHHGADDNASGTAGLLELARIFSAQRPRLNRTLIFIAFGGEEEGLLGSNYYVNHPAVPLANTVAMINMDMIGRMRDRKLSIGGVGTATEWKEIITQANNSLNVNVPANSTPIVTSSNGVPIVVSSNGRPIVTFDPRGTFDLTLNEDGLGPSDHSSFYLKQIPVLFFFTGAHNDYHKPSDTFEKINYTDEARILTLITRIVRELDEAEKRPTYVSVKSSPTPRTGGFRVYVGTIPNYADSTNGLLIDGVRDASPAAKAGIRAGDRVVKIGDREIKNVYDYTYALGEMKAGQEYVFEVMRGNEKVSLKVIPEAGRR